MKTANPPTLWTLQDSLELSADHYVCSPMSPKPMKSARNTGERGTFDRRDKLILALWAQLKAERETREAIEETIRSGGLSKDVLMAMASDPIPVITSDDVAEVERFAASHNSEKDHSAL